MQAVILAAGKGIRMQPLTLERPKPLVVVSGKPILLYILEALPQEITEIIIIIGYRGDMIRSYIGADFQGKRVLYIEQEKHEGTYAAMKLAEPYIEGKFLLLNADDIHGRGALVEALKHPYALIVAKTSEPEKFGVVSLTEDGMLASIIEKPEKPESNLVNTGAMVLDKEIFSYQAPREENGEYYMTKSLTSFAEEHPVAVVTQSLWIPIGAPEDISRTELLLKNLGIEEHRNT